MQNIFPPIAIQVSPSINMINRYSKSYNACKTNSSIIISSRMYSFCSTSLSAYSSYCSTSLTGLPVQSRLSPSFCCKYKSFKTSSKITSRSAPVFFQVLIAVQILQDLKYNHVSYQTKQTIFQVLITIL